jgi:hypothetical protein
MCVVHICRNNSLQMRTGPVSIRFVWLEQEAEGDSVGLVWKVGALQAGAIPGIIDSALAD